jgi:hypothetical protein
VSLSKCFEVGRFSLMTSRSSPLHNLICGTEWSMTFKKEEQVIHIMRRLISILIIGL